MATLAEVKAQARAAAQRGDWVGALRAYDAIVRTAPLDADARLKIADALAALKEPSATDVYRQVATFGLRGGRPLLGIVALRLLAAARQPVGDLEDAFTAAYAAGSARMGPRAARVSPPDPAQPVAAPDPTIAPQDVARRAIQCLDGFEDWPAVVHPIPLLSQLAVAAFRRVLSELTPTRLGNGASVIREGEPGRALYLVASGRVRVTRGELSLGRLGEGAIFGEMALLSARPRSASVMVTDDADLLELDRTSVGAIARSAPQAGDVLLRFARERLLLNVVASSPLFRPFSRDQQRDILARFTSIDVSAGAPIVREGEAGRGLYLVLAGEVGVTRGGTPVAVLGPGDLFGEISLVRGGPTTATVAATTPSTVLFLARDYVERLFAAFPDIKRYFDELSEERLLESTLIAADDELVEADERIRI